MSLGADLSFEQLRWLLHNLSTTLGHRLTPSAYAELVAHPPRDCDDFTRAVFVAEGLPPPDRDESAYLAVRSMVAGAFERCNARLGMRRYKHIVVLTGAGISRAAGLATYRGPGGLWSDPELEVLSHASSLADRRVAATNMFWEMHEAVAGVEPTTAHRALAAFEASAPDSMLIVTQNVDGLHQRAGSQRVVEYHGGLRYWLCERCGARVEPPRGDAAPVCCELRMRPDAVLFGELIPAPAEHEVTRALRDCDAFVAIGTSGTVWPAAGFVTSARDSGARTILLDLEIDDEARELYDECHAGPADELVTRWFGS